MTEAGEARLRLLVTGAGGFVGEHVRQAVEAGEFGAYDWHPAPEGFDAAKVKPKEAFFSKELGEFLLHYEAVRTASDPEAALMEFLESTYEAAANLAKWDRKTLECGLGERGKPRTV